MAKLCMGCMRIKESGHRCEHCGFDERSNNGTHQLPVGTIVGRQYTLGRVLGQGGFGITYIGWDNINQQRVAVKEYFPTGYAGRDSRSLMVTSYDGPGSRDFENNKSRFLREAEALAQLRHIPQIVKVLRYFEENGTAYIAMEYIEGQDLRRHLKNLGRPMTVEETLSVLGPVMEAMEQVHRVKLVHRDISPDNIMLLPDGSTKLLDFGAARYVQNANAYQNRDTSTQAILKHGFAPPEQYSTHGALGPWTDVYAMCATVYYCLTGRVPPEAMIRSVEGATMNWDSIPGLTRRQKAALEKGMDLQPGKRFASMEELWQQLKPKESKPVPKKSKKPLLIAVLAAAALLIASSGLQLFDDDKLELPKETTQKTDPESQPETSEEIPPSSETETGEMILSITPNLDLTEVEYGYQETIQILSGQSRNQILWQSSDPNVAEVSSDGTVTAVGFGNAKIYAQYGGITEICYVSVTLKANVTCEYYPNGGGYTICGFTGDVPSRIIFPQKIDGRPVTIIGDGSFNQYPQVTSIIIPEGVLQIGYAAFHGCKNLQSVTIPSSVQLIDVAAFNGCGNLNGIILPDGITVIGEFVFEGCTELTEIVIPEGVTEIMWNAFAGCTKLERVIIPDSVESIGTYAFGHCAALTSIRIPESVVSIANDAFQDCTSLKSVEVSRNCKFAETAFPEECEIIYY